MSGEAPAEDPAREPAAPVRPGWRARWKERLAPLVRAAEELPPPPEEAALGTVLGAVALALGNAVDIVATVSLPPGGVRLRALHHLFDALLTIGVAGALALPFALAAASRAWVAPSPRLVKAAWAALAVASAAAMYAMLDSQLDRQAHVAFDGFLAGVILPVYVTLCGLALPAGYLLGALGARLGRIYLVTALAGIGGIVLGHVVVRDDQPGVHAAILWVSAALFGTSVASRVRTRLKLGDRPLLGLCASLALATALYAPPNSVRLQLFRQPGAVAPWVLARVRWSLPAVGASAELPTLAPVAPEVMAASRKGVPPSPVVVVVTVDALRADALLQPDAAKRYPHIAQLKKSGVEFTRASAAGSQTAVSLTAMFASRYFSQMRWAITGTGRFRFVYATGDTSPRFPELLTQQGVTTRGFLPIIFLSTPFGVTRGFGEETLVVDDRRHAAADEVMQPLLTALENVGPGPAFFYVHLMEAHEPYDRGALKEGSDWERYLSEIEVVDVWIGKLVAAIRRHLRSRAYVILSADHGEAFGEHGTKFHTKTLYEELLRVPLVLWGPGIVRRKVDARVSLVDIGPTVMHLLDQPIPESFMGRSLLPLARGQLSELPRPVIAEGRLRRAMYVGDLKVIEDTLRQVIEVYDLAEDPGETVNLFDSDPARSHPLVAQLRKFFAEETLLKEGVEPVFKP